MNYHEKYVKYKLKYLKDKNYLKGGFDNKEDFISNFKNQLPKKEIYELVKIFGKPEFISNEGNEDGMVMWKPKDIFTMIMVVDELTNHDEPSPHKDFVFVGITVFIPEDIIFKVLKLSKSLFYYQLNGNLNVSCNSLSNVVAILYLAMMIINDPSNFDKYKSKYTDTINNSKEKYNELYTDLKKMILENQKKYKEKLPKKYLYESYNKSNY